MMSGSHFKQLRTRLKGLGLGRVGMEKLKNSHKVGVMRKFRTRGGVMRKFRTSTIHPPFYNFEARSNGEIFWLLKVGNAG